MRWHSGGISAGKRQNKTREMMELKRLFAAAVSIGLCLLMLPAAFATEYGQPDITADTTLKQVRENPSIAGSGILTYSKLGDSYNSMTRRMFENETISQYVVGNGEDSAAGLNLAIENYNRGIQVTWQVYTPEEIGRTPARAAVQLFWFPAEQTGSRYAIVLGGNALGTSGELSEGYSAAAELHQLGYTVFVLRYSIEENRADNAPLEDLTRAVRLVTEHADEFGVQTEDYALVGFSSGAQIAGVFANRNYGYEHYGVQKPGVLLMAYPIVDLSAAKLACHISCDPADYGWKYYWMNLKDAVEDGYPPVYFWRGDNDRSVSPAWMPGQHDDFAKALEAHGVPYQKIYYKNAPHGIGTGRGTDAEGWIEKAAAFWEEQCRGETE